MERGTARPLRKPVGNESDSDKPLILIVGPRCALRNPQMGVFSQASGQDIDGVISVAASEALAFQRVGYRNTMMCRLFCKPFNDQELISGELPLPAKQSFLVAGLQRFKGRASAPEFR